MSKDNRTLSGKKLDKKKDIKKINNWLLDELGVKDETNQLADIFYSGLINKRQKK
jgi:hypothetical protein